MRVAYFVNQYPKISHSFIRREILALEHQGIDVHRIALRGWSGELADAVDELERERTHYVLQSGISGLLKAACRLFAARPLILLKTLMLAIKMGLRAERPLPYHLIYLGEACYLVPLLHNNNISHMHAHFGTNSAEVVMLASALSGISYSFTVHGSEEFDRPEYIGFGEKIARSAFVAAVTSYTRSQLYRWSAQKDWMKINVVHCGLDQAFYDVPAVSIPDSPRLVCVGRLCEQKGHALLVEAVSRLVSSGIDVEVVFAGDGERRAEVEAMINAFGLNRHIRITGWLSGEQVRDELLAARALVLPSFAEGLPVVIMEAMALRRPVLTTYVGGIPELVNPGENGWLFPAGSIEDLATAMEKCLGLPVAELEDMGEKARKRVLERHNIEREAQKLIALFAQTTGVRTPAAKAAT